MTKLHALKGTHWAGRSELWLDPLGNEPTECDCTLAIDDEVVRYTWSRDGKAHRGEVALSADGAVFTDSWHQPAPMHCAHVPTSRGLFNVEGTYSEEWGWRINLSVRTPTGELVLQMTNIAPWGEEVRAVRMVGAPTSTPA